MRFWTCFIFLLLAVGSLLAQPPGSSHDDQREIEEVMKRRNAVARRGDVEGWVELFTEDAIVMPANRPIIRGREAIRKWEQAFVQAFTVHAQAIPEEIVITGDWAFCRSRIRGSLRSRSDHRELKIDGKEIAILRRRPEGWRIGHLIGNSNRAPHQKSVKVP